LSGDAERRLDGRVAVVTGTSSGRRAVGALAGFLARSPGAVRSSQFCRRLWFHWGPFVHYRVQPMNFLPPASKARRAFMYVSALVSIVAFLILGSTVLLDQWIIGQASTGFMVGTAILIVGLCTGLFAIITAIGLVVSVPLPDELQIPDEAQRPDRAEKELAAH